MRKEKKEKERKLTAAEQRRKERFEELKARLEAEGYVSQDLTIGVVRANVLALVTMMPFLVMFIIWYWWVNDAPGEPLSLLTLVLFLGLTVVHELIHGLVWGLCAQSGFKSIEFGIIWKAITPYCTCSEPLKKWQYILGAAMPTLVLGFVPGIVAVYTGQTILHYLSLLMILGGGGDFCIILKLLQNDSGKETIYCDHPCECGFVAFTRTTEN